MSARDKKLVLGAVCVFGALVFLKNPKCGHGCKTVAEHFLMESTISLRPC
jgi:hypothetical protein